MHGPQEKSHVNMQHLVLMVLEASGTPPGFFHLPNDRNELKIIVS